MHRYGLVILLLLVAGSYGAAQTRQDPDKSYAGVGSGHYILAVSADGQFITLEDKSRWDIDPGAWFRTKFWAPEASMSVRRAEPGSEFAYSLHNLDEDSGAGANYVPR